MANLNVQVNDSPGNVLVHISAIQIQHPDIPYVIFPSEKVSDGNGLVTFVSLPQGVALPPLNVTAQCQNYVSNPTVFDGTADVTIAIPFTPYVIVGRKS